MDTGLVQELLCNEEGIKVVLMKQIEKEKTSGMK